MPHSASYFNSQYPLFSSNSSNCCSHLLPRLPVTSILPPYNRGARFEYRLACLTVLSLTTHICLGIHNPRKTQHSGSGNECGPQSLNEWMNEWHLYVFGITRAIKSKKKGGACSTYGIYERCVHGFGWETWGKVDHLEDPGVDGRIILKLTIFIIADFLYMFRASSAHHQQYKILKWQPPVQVVMVAGFVPNMAEWGSTCNHNYLYRWLLCQYFILLMMGAWRPKHVEKVCSNKICILLHHVSVLFNLIFSLNSMSFLLCFLYIFESAH